MKKLKNSLIVKITMQIEPISVTLKEVMGSDLSVVNAARVSFDKESSEVSERDKKLINYLAKNKHWTPFAHTGATFRIKAPIFVARQLAKHQVGLVWNEVSRRYVDTEPSFWFPKEWRGRPVNAKQGSGGTIDDNQESGRLSMMAHTQTKCAVDIYGMLLDSGVAPEMARMVLPQNMHTEWWWTGNVASFARVCHLRLDPHAQQESREVAELISREMTQSFPISWQALMEN